MFGSLRPMTVGTLALLLAAAVRADHQPPQQSQPTEQTEQAEPTETQAPQPVFRTGIDFVRVDVIVTDGDGNPVLDLGPDDFEIFEDGNPQTIESFKLVRISGVPEPDAEPARPIRSVYDEEREAAREDTRLFVIFLDDYHVRRGASLAVRGPLMSFLQDLGPLDMVAVMYPLTPVGDVRFTRDHGALTRMIQQFDGRKFDYTPRNQYEDRYAMYPSTVVERIRNEVSFSGLRALVTHLGALREGRKSVIVVSEGYTNMLPPQLREEVAGFRGTGPGAGAAGGFEDSAAEDTARFFADADLQFELRRVYDAANRSNTSLYTLDPRGLGVFEFGIDERVGFRTDQTFMRSTADTLRVLADQTDGRAIVNQADLEGGLRQVVRDTSFYYLVGYNSSEAPTDGKFHPIQVEVKRRGVQVRARTGYWALTAEETARALAPPAPGPDPAVAEALGAIAQPTRGRAARTWLATGRGPNGKTRITFVWEPLPAGPGARGDAPVRVSLMASGQDGQSYFRGHVPDVTLASAEPGGAGGAAPAARTGPSRVVFDADPGRVQLRISVEGAAGQVLDNAVQEILAPDFTTPTVALSTPIVIRARNVVELRSLSTDPDAVPSPGREFHRSERVLIRFEVYGPGTTPPTPTSALLNRAGESMMELSLGASAGIEGVHQLEVPLAGLAPGGYLVEIKATAEGGDAKELVAFRVVG